jgi:outer membrane biosynthesis protein TonB
MKRSLMAASSVLMFALALLAQQDQTEITRKNCESRTPRYPAIARDMNLRGSVKAEAVVQPNGMVKSVDFRFLTS